MKKFLRTACIVAVFYSGNLIAQCTNLTVPHYEGFTGITLNNELPACWAASNMSATCLTFTSTSGNYGAFYYSPAGQDYFYSPGFYLKAGVVYSVSCWYKITTASSSGWTNLSLLLGTSQSTTGLQSISSLNFPSAISYSPLTGTLTVSANGNYHFALAATSSGSGGSTHLMWDDFRVEVPCSLNSPSLTAVVSPSSVCAGDTVIFSATGADTYTWCGGVTGDTLLLVAPNGLFNCMGDDFITGTDTASGCESGITFIPLTVNPKPSVSAFANPPELCKGKISNLQAFGAQTYKWDFGASTSQTTVAPSATTMYTVTGVNQYGCWDEAVVNVTVHQLPVISISDWSPPYCALFPTTLTASGAQSYTWNIGSQMYFSNPLEFNAPLNSATVFLTGTSNDGCVNTYSVFLSLDICQGITEGEPGRLHYYPNPTAGSIYIEYTSDDPDLTLVDGLGIKQAIHVTKDVGSGFVVELKGLPDGSYMLLVDNRRFRILKISP